MASGNTTGTIFDIMRYSIHDGPGIRTTVFFKGCPLNCWWCHNPESQHMEQEIMFRENRCTGCGDCLKVCTRQAVKDLSKCSRCGSCVKVCPTGAREMVGRTVTVKEVIKEIEKDIIFYDESGGGATFSGGEPLMQPEFLQDLLESCKEKGIHTVVETCGFASWDILKKISKNVDLFLYDLKIIDEEEHRKYTGVSSKPILDNLKKLSGENCGIIVRIPVIPGINDNENNIKRTGMVVSSLGNVREIHLLPYHQAGTDKYRMSQKTYLLPEILPPEKDHLLELSNALKQFGLKVKIGG